jgi:2-(1,2-epoxy-1,2-dihydrophenyl)acetyl-CoA isomerase
VPDLIGYSVAQGVAHIRLTRPEVSNAFDLETARAFASTVERAATSDEVRAVLLTGEGKRFCAGGDVASFAAAADQPAYIHALATELDAGFRALSALNRPVVAAVHGAVAGAGLALMLSCDLVVADPATKFVFAYPGIGFTPDCGLSYLLPRSIGQQRALHFALVGEPATAADARSWGLITEVSADVGSRGAELAGSLARGPAKALGETRRLLRSSWELSRIEAGAEEAHTVTAMAKGSEAQRRIARFTKPQEVGDGGTEPDTRLRPSPVPGQHSDTTTTN